MNAIHPPNTITRFDSQKSTRHDVLEVLADGEFHSGVEIGSALNITRAAVWKHIQALTNDGIAIDSSKGRGYRLLQRLELLDPHEITTKFSSLTLTLMSDFKLFFEIDSTNTYLFKQLESQSIHANVILSEYQTQGRGRRNSAWHSPPGAGIYLSIGWRFEEVVKDLSCLSLAIGVAIVKALNKNGVDNIGLKWPNDIYYKEKKLGGILIETRMENAGFADVVIGIGINVNIADSVLNEIDQPAIDLTRIVEHPLSRNRMVADIVNDVFETLSTFATMGFQKDIERWRELDIAKNKEIVLRQKNATKSGRVIGIDEDGMLLMLIEGKEHKFVSGELSFKLDL